MVNSFLYSKIAKLLTHLLYITTKALVLQGIFLFFPHFLLIFKYFPAENSFPQSSNVGEGGSLPLWFCCYNDKSYHIFLKYTFLFSYNPRSSFFFASNSSSVIAPISKSSLYFFSSAAASGFEPKSATIDFAFSTV